MKNSLANQVALEMYKNLHDPKLVKLYKQASDSCCGKDCKCKDDCNCKGSCKSDCASCSDMSKKSEQELAQLLIQAAEELDNLGLELPAILATQAIKSLIKEANLTDSHDISLKEIFETPSSSADFTDLSGKEDIVSMESELDELEEDPEYQELNKLLEDPEIRKLITDARNKDLTERQVDEFMKDYEPELPAISEPESFDTEFEVINDDVAAADDNLLFEVQAAGRAIDQLLKSEAMDEEDELLEMDEELKQWLREQGIAVEDPEVSGPEEELQFAQKYLGLDQPWADKGHADDEEWLDEFLKNPLLE